ncbi:glycosyltransferase [Rarobacter faecitabidus]
MHGHISPLLVVASALVEAGNDVRFLTGTRYREAVEATGARWVGLPVDADYDDSDVDAAFPGRVGRRGVAAAKWDLRHIFLAPAESQLRAVDALLGDEPADIVLTETMFLGAMLMLCRPASERPPVVNLGIVPLSLTSRDTAPFALGLPPVPGAIGRLRNAFLQWTSERMIFRALHRTADDLARATTGHPLATFAMNYPATADAIVQLSVSEFEYPRSDAKVPVHFVGPVSKSAPDMELPQWWADLDGGRPIVHVTQGTVANADLTELVIPTIRALADRDVLVVATTGGRELPEIDLPDNARLASYLPYDLLVPRLSAFVTNGGYGGVHFALRHGVPVLATGNTEDKAEVAARVQWSGAGLRLKPRRGSLDPKQIASAVDRLLSERHFAVSASRIGASIAEAPGAAGIDGILREIVRGRAL